jgi:hypothetical protein
VDQMTRHGTSKFRPADLALKACLRIKPTATV